MLIAFEGGEASGKSTQARRIAARLGAVLTREPGGTEAGERVRALLLDRDGVLEPRAEALLMAAARAQHVAEVIGPALADGRTVLTDRYRGSSLAYQGYGRGLPLDEVEALSDLAGAPQPDLVVLLVVPADERTARLDGSGACPDRMEAAGAAFHQRVEEGYRALAAADPDRWVVIDGRGTPDEVEARVMAAIVSKRPELRPVPGP
ncbi:MAG: dTMP kinase [Acidimicrobiia bacterium]